MALGKLALPRIKLDQEPSIRERIIYVVALAGVAIFFMNTFWSPMTKNVARIQSEKKNLVQQVDAFQKLIDTTKTQLMQTKAETKKEPEIDEHVQKILDRKIADPTEEMNATVDQLGGRTVAKRIKVKKIDLGVRTDMKGYSVAPITIDILGPYTAVQYYLEAIEGMDRAVVVRSIDIKRPPESQQELETSLVVDLYIPKR